MQLAGLGLPRYCTIAVQVISLIAAGLALEETICFENENPDLYAGIVLLTQKHLLGARHFLRRADARQEAQLLQNDNHHGDLQLSMDSARAFETAKSKEEEASSWVHDPFTTADVNLDIDDDGVPFHWDPVEATENTDKDLTSMVFQSLQNLLATEQPLTTPTSDLLFREEEDSPHNAPAAHYLLTSLLIVSQLSSPIQ